MGRERRSAGIGDGRPHQPRPFRALAAGVPRHPVVVGVLGPALERRPGRPAQPLDTYPQPSRAGSPYCARSPGGCGASIFMAPPFRSKRAASSSSPLSRLQRFATPESGHGGRERTAIRIRSTRQVPRRTAERSRSRSLAASRSAEASSSSLAPSTSSVTTTGSWRPVFGTNPSASCLHKNTKTTERGGYGSHRSLLHGSSPARFPASSSSRAITR